MKIKSNKRLSILTIANLISISRILFAIPLVYTLSNNLYDISIAIIIYIFFSDMIDGYIARKSNQITDFGKLIDPVADKICMMVVLIYLIFEFKIRMPFLIYFFVLSIRDLYLITVGIYLMHKQSEVFESNKSGKWFMAISAIMMISFIYSDYFQYTLFIPFILYIISCVLFLVSTIEYTRRYLNYFKIL